MRIARPARAVNGYTKLFSQSGYLWLFSYRLSSALAAWIEVTLMFMLLISRFEAGAVPMGLAAGLLWLPQLLLGPWAGGLADRSSAQRMLMFAGWVRIAASVFIVFAPTVALFFLGIAVRALGGLGASAIPVATRALVPIESMADHSRLSVMVDQGTRLIAPLVGVAFVLLPNPQYGFIACALCGVCCVYCAKCLGRSLPTLNPKPRNRKVAKKRASTASGYLHTLISTYRTVTSLRALSETVHLAIIFALLLGLREPLLPIVIQTYGMPADTYGYSLAFASLGAIGGAHFIPSAMASWGAPKTIYLQIATAGLLSIFLGCLVLSEWDVVAWAIYGYMLLSGTTTAMTLAALAVVLQERAPVGRIGAVNGLVQSARILALVVGPVLGGALVSLIGIPSVLFIVAAVAMVTVVAFRQSKRDPT